MTSLNLIFVVSGYNATVLAYGQTGSGKTFSMGGGYGISLDTGSDVVGIIPRVICRLFEGIEEKAGEHDYVVRVSYLEVNAVFMKKSMNRTYFSLEVLPM